MKPTWERGNVRLYLGDCREVLPHVGKCDVCITDPPYGVEFRGNEWDKDIPEIATQLPSMFGRVAIVMGTEAAWSFPKPKWTACWARPASNSRSKVGGFSHWSPILLYGECKMRVDFKSWHAIAHAYPHGFGHPSPKPECVMLWLAEELAEYGETIIDPFMGSGTTGVAAVQTGRAFVGIEIDPTYFEIAVRRIDKAIDAGALFAPVPPAVREVGLFGGDSCD